MRVCRLEHVLLQQGLIVGPPRWNHLCHTNKALDAVKLGGLEQHVGAEHIVLRERERVAERVVDVGLRRKSGAQCRYARYEHVVDQIRGKHRSPLMNPRPEACICRLAYCQLSMTPPAPGCAGSHSSPACPGDNRVRRVRQAGHHMAADEPSPARRWKDAARSTRRRHSPSITREIVFLCLLDFDVCFSIKPKTGQSITTN